MSDRVQGLEGVDATVPNVARMYDYYLGGKDNFAADREAAGQILAMFPDTPAAALTNRRFLARAVRYLAAEQGIRQFIDIGAGLPTRGSVHEVAASVAPDARVVYVDHDPVVAVHAQALLAGTDEERIGVVRADLRRPGDLLDDPQTRRLIDFSRPVAVLLVAVLHFLPDDADPYALVARLRDALAPGSYLVVSHLTSEGVPADLVRGGQDAYRQATAPIVPRPRAGIHRFLDGFDPVDPGLAWVADWRPDLSDQESAPGHSHGFAAVARKPGRPIGL